MVDCFNNQLVDGLINWFQLKFKQIHLHFLRTPPPSQRTPDPTLATADLLEYPSPKKNPLCKIIIRNV